MVGQLDADGVAALHHRDAGRDRAHRAGDVVGQRDHPRRLRPRRRLKLIQRHYRAGTDVDDLALDVEVPQHVLESRSILLQHFDRHFRAVPDFRLCQKLQVRKLELERSSHRRRDPDRHRCIVVAAVTTEAVIGRDRNDRTLVGARRRHDGGAARRNLDDIPIIHEIVTILVVVPWQYFGLCQRWRWRRNARLSLDRRRCLLHGRSLLPLGLNGRGRRGWHRRCRQRWIQQISAGLPHEAIGLLNGRKLIGNGAALCGRRCRRLGRLRSRGSFGSRSSWCASVRCLPSCSHRNGPLDLIGCMRRRAGESACRTTLSLLRSRFALERQQPLLNGRCWIGRSDRRDLFRLPFRSISPRLRCRLHPALFQNAFGRTRETDIRSDRE